MAELFAIVTWWIVATLIGIAVGSLAAVLGLGSLTAMIGAVALLVGGVFVFGSVLANNMTALRRSEERGASGNHVGANLAGAGLLRATLVGFLGAGLIVGSLNGNGLISIVACVVAVAAVMLMATGGSRRDRIRK